MEASVIKTNSYQRFIIYTSPASGKDDGVTRSSVCGGD